MCCADVAPNGLVLEPPAPWRWIAVERHDPDRAVRQLAAALGSGGRAPPVAEQVARLPGAALLLLARPGAPSRPPIAGVVALARAGSGDALEVAVVSWQAQGRGVAGGSIDGCPACSAVRLDHPPGAAPGERQLDVRYVLDAGAVHVHACFRCVIPAAEPARVRQVVLDLADVVKGVRFVRDEPRISAIR